MSRRTHALVALVLASGAALAGPLAPPSGPVTSTMKTLVEVEPRIAINAANTPGDADSVFKITQSGSYYLTSDFIVAGGGIGIQIAANNVTVDLNGFTITGSGGSGSCGIADTLDETDQIERVTVRNGRIDNFTYGVRFDWLGTGTLTDLSISRAGNGVFWNGGGQLLRCSAFARTLGEGTGFSIDGSGLLDSCEAGGFGAGFFAVDAPVSNCTSRYCASGFVLSGATTSHCAAFGAAGVAFQLGSDAVLEDSLADGGATGVDLNGIRGIVRRCTIVRPTAFGIRVRTGTQSIIEDNTLIGTETSTQVGIKLESVASRCIVQRNSGVNNGGGIIVLGTENLILGNCFGKPFNSNAIYSFAAGNRYGPLVRAATGGAASVGTASPTVAGTITTTDPNANLFY